jgi:hypothetical protein
MLPLRTCGVCSPICPASVPDSLPDELQTSLDTAYTLGRELAGGGMSRVFVALEEALGRDVVVKVLAVELVAGLSAERCPPRCTPPVWRAYPRYASASLIG